MNAVALLYVASVALALAGSHSTVEEKLDEECSRSAPIANPAFIQQLYLLDRSGAIVHEWSAYEHGIMQWADDSDSIMYLAPTPCGAALRLMMPDAGIAETLGYPKPFWRYEIKQEGRLIEMWLGTSYRIVTMSARLVDTPRHKLHHWPASAIRSGAVFVGGRMIAEDRGQEWTLMPSPSHQWMLLVAQQPKGSDVMYRVTEDGAKVVWVRKIEEDERIEVQDILELGDSIWSVAPNGQIVAAAGGDRRV